MDSRTPTSPSAMDLMPPLSAAGEEPTRWLDLDELQLHLHLQQLGAAFPARPSTILHSLQGVDAARLHLRFLARMGFSFDSDHDRVFPVVDPLAPAGPQEA